MNQPDYRLNPFTHPELTLKHDPYSAEADMRKYGAETIAFVGPKGAGKSLSAVAAMLDAAANEIARGIPPKQKVSNLHLNVPFQ